MEEMMTDKETDHKKDQKKEGIFEFGFGGILKGISDLVERVGELAKEGEEFCQSGEILGGKDKKNLRGVYGFSISTGLNKEKVHIEPFGNLRKDKSTGYSVVQEIREPLVDIFEEESHILILAEMPGVSAEEVQFELQEDVLIFWAERGERKYRKEILLPCVVEKEKISITANNGVVEIRCSKK